MYVNKNNMFTDTVIYYIFGIFVSKIFKQTRINNVLRMCFPDTLFQNGSFIIFHIKNKWFISRLS